LVSVQVPIELQLVKVKRLPAPQEVANVCEQLVQTSMESDPAVQELELMEKPAPWLPIPPFVHEDELQVSVTGDEGIAATLPLNRSV